MPLVKNNNNNSVIANVRNLHISVLHEQGKILRVAALGSRNHSHGYPLAPDPLMRSGTFNTQDWLLPLRHWKISLQGLTRLLKLLELVCLLTVVPEEKALVTLQLKDYKEAQSSSWRTESRYSKRKANILKNEKSETPFCIGRVIFLIICNVYFYLFIYFWLCWVFLCCVQAFYSCGEQGLLSGCGAWASH